MPHARNTLNQKEIHKINIKGQKAIFHLTGTKKQMEVASLFSDKVGFKTKLSGRVCRIVDGVYGVRGSTL